VCVCVVVIMLTDIISIKKFIPITVGYIKYETATVLPAPAVPF